MTKHTKQTTRANGDRTKRKLLDAAEELFGANGFDTVSLRDITERAEVTLALASYHFGTKEKLFEAVVARRASLLCELRRERLKSLGPQPATRDVLNAFIAPLFEQVSSRQEGWASYIRVLARLGEDDRRQYLLSEHFDTVAQEFMAVLSTSYPKCDQGTLARAFTMTLQLMLTTVSQNRRLDLLTKGAERSDDLHAAHKYLLDFADAGFTALTHSR